MLWIDDTRPFWHPLVTVPVLRLLDRVLRQRRRAVGQARVRSARPGARGRDRRADRRRAGDPGQGLLARLRRASTPTTFALEPRSPASQRPVRQPLLLLKFREARAAAALHKAEAERHLLSKQAIEAELKLMQAQVEPHFLFNTLASVQYLTETDPPQAHAAARPPDRLPARRAAAAARALARRWARRSSSPRRTSTSCKMRMGARLAFAIDVPDELRDASVSADPADLARRERRSSTASSRRPTAARIDDRARAATAIGCVVTVTDTGRGLAGDAAPAGQRRRPLQRARAARGAVRRRGPLHARADARRAARARRSRFRSKPRPESARACRCRPR